MPLSHRRTGAAAASSSEAEVPEMQLAEWIDPGLSPSSAPFPGGDSAPDTIVANSEAFAPADLQTFYDESPLLSKGINGGSGDCIAVVGDSDFLNAAVSDFDAQFGLPASSITRVLADSTNPGINGDESEALLDLEWSHAAAPGAAQRYYLASGSITDAISKAVSDNACGTISVSFSLCGSSSSTFTSLNSVFAQAAAQGQSVFVSSGDDGAAGVVLNSAGTACVVGSSRNVNEMSASPNVTAVGGTQFTPTYNSAGADTGKVPESVWDESIGPAAAARARCSANLRFRAGQEFPPTAIATCQTSR